MVLLVYLVWYPLQSNTRTKLTNTDIRADNTKL